MKTPIRISESLLIRSNVNESKNRIEIRENSENLIKTRHAALPANFGNLEIFINEG